VLEFEVPEKPEAVTGPTGILGWIGGAACIGAWACTDGEGWVGCVGCADCEGCAGAVLGPGVEGAAGVAGVTTDAGLSSLTVGFIFVMRNETLADRPPGSHSRKL